MNLSDLTINKATEHEIYAHLDRCSHIFNPPLNTYVDLKDYSRKIRSLASTFEIWENNQIVALIAVYMNNLDSKAAFISNVSVEAKFQGLGLASRLLKNVIEEASKSGFEKIMLQVRQINKTAIELYKKYGFELTKSDIDFMEMTKQL